MNTLVLSANNIRFNRLEALLMSLMYSNKHRGLRIEPWGTPQEISFLNPFAPGDFAEKRVLKLVEWFAGHCHAIKG